MADIFKYVIYWDQLIPQAAGNIKISPLDHIGHCFGDSDTPADGVQIVDLGQPSGTGTNVGFGMRTLKDGSKLPHSIALLKLADGAAGQTPPSGLSNNAIEDAVAALTALGGGYEITEQNALDLATELFPAGQYEDEDGVTWDVSAPKLVDHVLKRDITEVT